MRQTDSPGRRHALSLDEGDSLRPIREEFVIPTRNEMTSKTIPHQDRPNVEAKDDETPCTYLCGNSLGLQPRRTATRIRQYLDTWGTQGVQGHFKPMENSPLPTWLNVDARAASMMAPIVGARESEVAVMQTLTANLHFLMCAFYRPDRNGRHKIILESKAFPSDHIAVETQIRLHGLSPAESMVCIEPPSPDSPVLATDHILSTIDKHAADTAVLLLPGIQYYTGQLLDIPTITAFARARSIFVIWDLAHAAGNVPLQLHDWDVDAAAWCSYKYLNSGPGCIASLFVHSRHTVVAPAAAANSEAAPEEGFAPRLAGWWGNDKATRFAMDTTAAFRPAPGAAGFQLSNPSVLDTTALCASLEVFEAAGGMGPLREKSLRLTAYLESLLGELPEDVKSMFRIITPRAREERGAQLSILLTDDALLGPVMEALEARAVIVDERKPNVIRVAPAPLYNSFTDCYDFVQEFRSALERIGSGTNK
ncbi:hypothetical protein ACRALDRAFT_1038151 [Sodiomyces alcalophilus JCM 7366]|uniref:uncharacterized protein n=1 Tax=Sodiomyces alcalophilus JCM 7366 TaxID=591952 RepID=UPI0039B6B968